MTHTATGNELRSQLRELDTEIAQLETAARAADSQHEVRSPEEIASDLTLHEEQQALLEMLERRRQSIRSRLERLDD